MQMSKPLTAAGWTCREKLRQSQLDLRASSGQGTVNGVDLGVVLNQDLVAARVQLDSLQRRLEMADRERERASQSLGDTLVSP